LLSEKDDKTLFITIEDLIPWRLYATCLSRYLKKWKSATFAENAQHLQDAAKKESKTEAHVKHAERILSEIGGNISLDKMGILIEVVKVLTDDREEEFNAEVSLLSNRIQRMCQRLNVRIERSRQHASHRSVAHNVKRLIREFLQSREHGCSVIDADNILDRIDREGRVVEESSERLRATIAHLRSQLDAYSQAGQSRLASGEWSIWKSRFEFLKRDPLNPSLPDEHPDATQKSIAPVNSDAK
jgi:hypothetical protein